MLNLLKIKNWSGCHRNKFCGHEHKGWKYRLAVENEPVQKGESAMILKVMYWGIQLGGGNSLWRTLYALNEKCLGQVWLEKKKRNHQKFWVWAKYNSKWTEIWFLAMHLVQPGSSWQYNYNQRNKHNHEKPLWLSWGYKKHILVQMNTFKGNFYYINSGISRLPVYFSLCKIRTKEAYYR